MVRDCIVRGINNSRIQSRLLQERNLTYQIALGTAQGMELAAKDIADMQKGTPSTMVPHQPVHQLNPSKERKQRIVSITIECYRYGGNHYATKCKFRNVDFRSSGKKGHLAIARLFLPHDLKVGNKEKLKVVFISTLHSLTETDTQDVR